MKKQNKRKKDSDEESDEEVEMEDEELEEELVKEGSDEEDENNEEDDEDEDGEEDEEEEEGDEECEEENIGSKRAKSSHPKRNSRSAKKVESDEGSETSETSNIPKKRKRAHNDNSDTKSKSLQRDKKPKIEAQRDVKVPKTKQSKKLERLEEARKAFKWWEAEELPEGIQWRKLEHAGVVFPPPYQRHNVPLIYDGKPVTLTDEQEEIVTFYAAMPEDGPQLGNPKTRGVFQTNFFRDFKETLPRGHVIKDFNKCDFSRIREHLEIQKNLKKAATTEEKTSKKVDKEIIMQRQGFALIDGRLEKVIENFNMNIWRI